MEVSVRRQNSAILCRVYCGDGTQGFGSIRSLVRGSWAVPECHLGLTIRIHVWTVCCEQTVSALRDPDVRVDARSVDFACRHNLRSDLCRLPAMLMPLS